MAWIMTGAAVVSAGTGVANAISGNADARKRRLYEQNLALLTFDQKEKLEKLVREANSEDARQAILAQTIGSANTARIEGLSKLQAEKEKTKKTVITIALVGGFIVIGGLLFIRKKN